MAWEVLGKVNARIKFIARYASFLNNESLKVLATGLVLSQLEYACCSWMTDLSSMWMAKLQK